MATLYCSFNWDKGIANESETWICAFRKVASYRLLSIDFLKTSWKQSNKNDGISNELTSTKKSSTISKKVLLIGLAFLFSVSISKPPKSKEL